MTGRVQRCFGLMRAIELTGGDPKVMNVVDLDHHPSVRYRIGLAADLRPSRDFSGLDGTSFDAVLDRMRPLASNAQCYLGLGMRPTHVAEVTLGPLLGGARRILDASEFRFCAVARDGGSMLACSAEMSSWTMDLHQWGMPAEEIASRFRVVVRGTWATWLETQ